MENVAEARVYKLVACVWYFACVVRCKGNICMYIYVIYYIYILYYLVGMYTLVVLYYNNSSSTQAWDGEIEWLNTLPRASWKLERCSRWSAPKIAACGQERKAEEERQTERNGRESDVSGSRMDVRPSSIHSHRRRRKWHVCAIQFVVLIDQQQRSKHRSWCWCVIYIKSHPGQ